LCSFVSEFLSIGAFLAVLDAAPDLPYALGFASFAIGHLPFFGAGFVIGLAVDFFPPFFFWQLHIGQFLTMDDSRNGMVYVLAVVDDLTQTVRQAASLPAILRNSVALTRYWLASSLIVT